MGLTQIHWKSWIFKDDLACIKKKKEREGGWVVGRGSLSSVTGKIYITEGLHSISWTHNIWHVQKISPLLLEHRNLKIKSSRWKLPVWKCCRAERAHMADFFKIYIAVKHLLVTAIDDCWSVRCRKYICSVLGWEGTKCYRLSPKRHLLPVC